jgi:hypothetical protein
MREICKIMCLTFFIFHSSKNILGFSLKKIYFIKTIYRNSKKNKIYLDDVERNKYRFKKECRETYVGEKIYIF